EGRTVLARDLVDQAGYQARAHSAQPPRTERPTRAHASDTWSRNDEASAGHVLGAATNLRCIPRRIQQRASSRSTRSEAPCEPVSPITPALPVQAHRSDLSGSLSPRPCLPERRDQLWQNAVVLKSIAVGGAHRGRGRRGWLLEGLFRPSAARADRPSSRGTSWEPEIRSPASPSR